MTEVDLKITGTVEALRLEPGDRIMVTLDTTRHIRPEDVERIRERVAEKFPDHEVIILSGMRLAPVSG